MITDFFTPFVLKQLIKCSFLEVKWSYEYILADLLQGRNYSIPSNKCQWTTGKRNTARACMPHDPLSLYMSLAWLDNGSMCPLLSRPVEFLKANTYDRLWNKRINGTYLTLKGAKIIQVLPSQLNFVLISFGICIKLHRLWKSIYSDFNLNCRVRAATIQNGFTQQSSRLKALGIT